jgi:hypothetical protein
MRYLLALLALASPSMGEGLFRANLAIGNQPIVQDPEGCDHGHTPDPCNMPDPFTKSWNCTGYGVAPEGWHYEVDWDCATQWDDWYHDAYEGCNAIACYDYCEALKYLEAFVELCQGDPDCLLWAAQYYANMINEAKDYWGECLNAALVIYLEADCCILVEDQ